MSYKRVSGNRLVDNKRQKKSELIEKDTWTDKFKELETIHFRLNSYFTFLSSRKHIITTIELLKEPVEKAINRVLTELDVARIAVLIPDDVVFDYFDENQFVLEDKHFSWKEGFAQKDIDIYDLKDDTTGDDKPIKQLLVFEFIDGDLRKSKTSSTYNNNEIKIPVYTKDSIRRLIVKRNNKFELAISNFIKDCEANSVENPWMELTSKAQNRIPKPLDYTDPIEEMINKSLEPNVNSIRPSMEQMIDKLKTANFYKEQIEDGARFIIEPRSAEFKELDYELTPMIKAALKESKGIETLYSHQTEAISQIHNGKNIIISTSTSSGKSLVYQIPVLSEIESNASLTAMYIFPTKALAQDQRRSLKDLLDYIPELHDLVVETYDGDTERKQREYVRYNGSIIFTNPDIIHTTMLPSHQQWRRFLSNLKYVIVDELHMYKGLFGSHVSLIMRRLRRICAMLGNNNIIFISCSATLKDPVMHMHNIFGIPLDSIAHIDKDGSPSGSKHLVVWNPPYIDPSDPIAGRQNFISESAKIVVELMKNNVRTIIFCVVRKVVELLMKEVRQLLKASGENDLIGQVMSYRGGYSAADRRKIESQMFHGNLKAIISTNALELGIDIGGLDAVVMCGFPISVANFHQQSGRAGRRNKDSLTVLVGSGDPVSQHFMKHPEELIKTDFPDLALDFDNIIVLEGHLQCAAFEISFHQDLNFEIEYFGEFKRLKQICDSKLDFDDLNKTYHCSSKFLPWPSKSVSIRAIEQDTYAVVDITNGRNIVIEEIEASRTSFTLYDGGIFIHQGLPYIVRDFNTDEKVARVERVNVDWTTNQRDFTDIDPVEIERIRSLKSSDVPIYFGKIRTTIVVFGFFKMDKNNKILDAVEVNNPPVILNSKGIWIDIPKKALQMIHSKQLSTSGGIHAAQHAIMNLLPLFVISGSDEIKSECKAPEKEFAKRETKRKRPARLIFNDNKGGQFGSGLSTKVFDNIDTILEKSLENILECDCEWGCPNCCASTFCKERSLVLSKFAAIIIFAVILDREIDLDSIPNGPEANMPVIEIETTLPVSEVGMVKFSKDLEIVDVRKSDTPLSSFKQEKIFYVKTKGVSNGKEKVIKVKEEDDKVPDRISEDEDEFSEDDLALCMNL